MPKIKRVDFAKITAEVRTWPAKDRADLAGLIAGWEKDQAAKPERKARKVKAPTQPQA